MEGKKNPDTDHSTRHLLYYAPNRETIWQFVQHTCDELTSMEDSITFSQEIRREFAEFVELVTAISVEQANRKIDQSLDSATHEE